MDEQELHIRDYVRIVVKRRYTVYTFFTVVFLVFVIATLTATPEYMATTRVLIEKSEPANIAMNFYYEPYDPDFFETQYQLINSPTVAERVAGSLMADPKSASYARPRMGGDGVIGGTVGWFRGVFSVVSQFAGITSPKKKAAAVDPEAEAKLRHDALVGMINGGFIVNPVKDTRVVNISFMSTDPDFAAAVVNALPKAYMEDVMERKMSSSNYAARWLTEKAAEERDRIEKAEKALQDYMRDNDIVTLENKVAVVPEKLSEVATKVAEAETKKKEKEALYAAVKDVSRNTDAAEAIPAIASDPTVQALRVQILNAEQGIIELSKKYGKKHPEMIRAQEELKGLKAKKDQEIRRVIESIKYEYDMAKVNAANLEKMVGQAKADTMKMNEKFVQYSVLKREAETSRQLFDSIVKQIKEQSITQDLQRVSVWVLEKATVPRSPARPQKSKNILYGFMLGLFGGVGLAFFVEYLDNTVKSPDDVESKLSAPVLGVVTLLKGRERSIEEIVAKEPQSTFAESYKGIRTAVLLSSADRPPRNILITSISPSEGKTATAVNLALTIAQSEHSVLLVDSDLRRPRVHKIFGLDNSNGLSSYLAGASSLNIASKGLPNNLSVISSGPIPPNPSELLGSSRMADLLRLLEEKFDIVVWDSAPLLTVTDSLILSKVLDGTIIVARAGETTYESARRGVKSLRDIEAHFLGVVINAYDIKKGDSRYSGYYYHNYY
jgi:succinoglycan biosynthesis transport protein ExoP